MFKKTALFLHDGFPYDTGTVTLILHLDSVLKKSCIEFAVSNGKKLDSQQVEAEKGTRETESSISGKYTVASSERQYSSPEDLAAVELIFRILSTGPVSKYDLHSKHNLSIERTPQLWEVDGEGLVGLAPSWVENILHFALNVTETEFHHSGPITEAKAVVTKETYHRTKRTTPALHITNVTAMVQKKMKDWIFDRLVFKLNKTGPTFSANCPPEIAEYSSTSSTIIICLTLYLNKVLATSKIKVKVTNKEPEASSAPVENHDDILQEELDQLFISEIQSESILTIDEEEDEEFLSSRSPQVITIGNEDDEVETAEEALVVDIPDASHGAKQDKCIIT